MPKMTINERAETGQIMMLETLKLITKNYGLEKVKLICAFEKYDGDEVNGPHIITNMTPNEIKAWAMAIYDSVCEGKLFPCKGLKDER